MRTACWSCCPILRVELVHERSTNQYFVSVGLLYPHSLMLQTQVSLRHPPSAEPLVVPRQRLSGHLRFSGIGLSLSCEQPSIDMDLTCSISTSLDTLTLPLPSNMVLYNFRWSSGPNGARKSARPGPSLPFNSYVLESAISFLIPSGGSTRATGTSGL